MKNFDAYFLSLAKLILINFDIHLHLHLRHYYKLVSYYLIAIVGRNSSVVIATRYGVNGPGEGGVESR